MRTVLLLISIVLLLFPACKPGEIEMRIRPRAAGHYEMVFSTAGKVSMTLGAKEMGTEVNTRIASLLEIDTMPGDKFSFRLSYQDFNVKQELDGKKIDLKNLPSDSNNNIKNGMDLVKGISFQSVVGPTGKTETMHGADSVMKRLDNAMQEVPENTRRQLLAAMTPLVNNDMAKSLLEQCFYVLPAEKVNIGDSWKNEIEMNSMFSMIIKSKYTLEEIRDSIARIKVNALIKPGSPDVVMPMSALAMAAPKGSNPAPEKDGLDIFGMKMKAVFEGTEDGMVWVNMRTGLVQKSQLKQDLTGKISISILDLPMAMNMQTVYEVNPVAQ